MVEKPIVPKSIIDDDIMFGGGEVSQPAANPVPQPAAKVPALGGDLMDDLGGISFGGNQAPPPAKDDPFGLMGVNMG